MAAGSNLAGPPPSAGVPRVSIIIPAYNSAHFLQFALDSVLAQTYPSWEAVVIDDGSTDNTRDLIDRNRPAFADRLRYFYQENRGLPAARNAAIRHARGDVFALLDSDDIWMPHRLERTMAAMDAHPEVGITYGDVVRIDKNGAYLDRPPKQDPSYAAGRIAEYLYLRQANPVCPSVSFRRACIEKVGGFDETLRATEDRDMWFRIALHYPVFYIPEDIAYYRRHSTSMSRDADRMFNAQMVFLNKHRGSVSPSIYRRAVGNSYREIGDHYFAFGEPRRSIGWYWGALRRNPAHWSNWYMLARAIGEPVFGGAGHRAARGA